MDLTILVVSDLAWPISKRFVEVAQDKADRLDAGFVFFNGSGGSHIENVLDAAIAQCPDGYILRLDDDETISPAMYHWLRRGMYRSADHWAFPRVHLWSIKGDCIVTPPLWPDLQTRLSVKEKSGGRTRVHQGSPFGTGRIAPCAIEHHKFVVRTIGSRRRLADHYASLDPAAGSDHYRIFSVPEDYDFETVPYDAGTTLVLET